METREHTKSSKYNHKKKKTLNPESKFRLDLDICSRNRDLSGAISLYEFAISQQNIRLNQNHFNSLLYICSNSITDSTKDSAIEYGFRIFDHMLSNKINPNEATITATARIAAAKGDGDLAFELVKDMKKYGILPKLRSYGPALFCFCKNLEAEKAYLVEENLIEMGLNAEEPELGALLKVSVECGRSEKVYEYLHKMRKVLRCVGENIVEVLESWFGGEVGSEVGFENWDVDLVKDLILKNGGGWHGLGWLGKGKWDVRRTNVDLGGTCCSCKEQLVCVDIGREETEKFADSVASLAMTREVKSNFTEFQNWLDEHSEYEAIVDAANIGLYQQNFAEGGFSISQLVAVVKELYNRSKKWPLVILHNKRFRTLFEDSSYRELLEEWMEKGVLYGTPYGSNDDWYWLYAAVKIKCFLVTNDEMRDHIFELLGSSFFLKWKERHQIRYTFVKGELKLLMPPAYSLVTQESENGAWHVPLAGECSDELSRIWLCITRPGSCKASDEVATSLEASKIELLPHNHELLNSCQLDTTADIGSHGSSDLSRRVYDDATTITGKRKERSPSLSGTDHQT